MLVAHGNSNILYHFLQFFSFDILSEKSFNWRTSNPVLSVDKLWAGTELAAVGGGRLVHESVGDAILTLNKKLKVSNIILKGDQRSERLEKFVQF